jgi:predicted TIM-barrel fold metal-dependent hydrolase
MAGNHYMRMDQIRAGHLCELLIRHPATRFVIMHIAWPYSAETLSLAKHFANAFIDLCWAWSLDPRGTVDYVRQFLHAAPSSKLFGFGGDTTWPTKGVAYCAQMRRWLTRALEAEVRDGDLTEPQAIRIADRLLRDNQFAVFDIDGRRRAIKGPFAATSIRV